MKEREQGSLGTGSVEAAGSSQQKSGSHSWLSSPGRGQCVKPEALSTLMGDCRLQSSGSCPPPLLVTGELREKDCSLNWRQKQEQIE